MRIEGNAIRATIAWLFGPAIWAAHFFLLYGIAGLLCEPSNVARQEQIRLAVLALTALALILLIGFLTKQTVAHDAPGDLRKFLATTRKILAVLAIIGVVWTAAGAATLAREQSLWQSCMQFRQMVPQ